MSLIKLLLVISLVTMALPFATALSHISVLRALPTSVSAGSTFDVALTMNVDETNLSTGVIIKDWIPLGWNVLSSTPSGFFDLSTGEVKWVFFGSGVADQGITYTVEVPSSASGTKTFTGQILTTNNSFTITGDSEVVVSTPSVSSSSGGGGGGGGKISPVPEGVSSLNSSLMKEIIKDLSLEYKFYFDAPMTLASVLITVDEYPSVSSEVATVLIRTVQSLRGDVYDLASEKILENFMFANTLYIARGDIPVDSMAAVTYAKMKHVPIILTKTNDLPEPTLEAINKLQPDKIIIVGGPMAISNEVEDKLSEMAEVERIWGKTRYETAVEMAKSFESYYKYFDTVVITDGNDPNTDSAIIASGYKAPLLYVKDNGIPQAVRTFLQDHKKEYFGRQMKVLTVGVSEEVATEIEKLIQE